MKIKIIFYKMHGCGNDFVIIDNRKIDIKISRENLIKIAHRNYGIGCDQIILINRDKNYDCFMRIYNNDGSESGNCGNAARCVAKILCDEKKVEVVNIKTLTSHMKIDKMGNEYVVNMAEPKFNWYDIPTKYKIDTVNINLAGMSGFVVNVGNPHIVFFVDDLKLTNIHSVGHQIENNELFPEKINVNFAQIVSRDTLLLETWERGSGITFACGTGACATAIAAINKNLTDEKVLVKLKGGDLKVTWNKTNLTMRGEAILVYKGEIIL